MAGAALLAATGARRTDPLPMLALSAALMLGLAPNLVEDPGFQLSFLGTAGILLLASPIAARLPGPRLLVEPFAVTVAAQLATLPVMAGTFGVVAVVGPIANALVLPLLPVMIVAGGCGAILSAIHPAIGWLPLQLAGLGTSVVTAVARLVTAVPGAAIQVGSWPASWSIAEVAGLLTALLVVALAARRPRPTPR
jgi:competence protein ComEC